MLMIMVVVVVSAADLHRSGDRLPLWQNLGEILGTEHVAQRGLCEQAGRVVCVLDVGDRHGGVADPVVDHRVDRYRHRVLGQHLPGYTTHTETTCKTGWVSGGDGQSARRSGPISPHINSTQFIYLYGSCDAGLNKQRGTHYKTQSIKTQLCHTARLDTHIPILAEQLMYKSITDREYRIEMEQCFNILRKNSRLEAFVQIEPTWHTYGNCAEETQRAIMRF